MAGLLLRMCGVPATEYVCERCLYRAESWRDGGHCYMFRERPKRPNTCGQFRSVSG